MTNITVSLDYARKLRDAGWDRKCTFHYKVDDEGEWEDEVYLGGLTQFDLPAPTAEEILRELPKEHWYSRREDEEKKHYVMTVRRTFEGLDKWVVQYLGSDINLSGIPPPAHKEEADTLANAAAAMYCYLADNNLISQDSDV